MGIKSFLLRKIREFKIKNSWKKLNKHNQTWWGVFANQGTLEFITHGGISVGKNTYGPINVNYTGNKDEKLIIGSNCSLSTTVVFETGGEHDYSAISTFPFAQKIYGYDTDVISRGPIILDDEVWIGENALILSGVHIGKGAVVAAGSIVTRDVAPYSIVAGNPARQIKMRFSQEVVNKLMKIDLDINCMDDTIRDILRTKITDDNVDYVIEELRNRCRKG